MQQGHAAGPLNGPDPALHLTVPQSYNIQYISAPCNIVNTSFTSAGDVSLAVVQSKGC